MKLRQRRHDDTTTMARMAIPPAQDDVLLLSERFLAGGASAIDRALSKDSAAFLSTNRQEGGE